MHSFNGGPLPPPSPSTLGDTDVIILRDEIYQAFRLRFCTLQVIKDWTGKAWERGYIGALGLCYWWCDKCSN